MNIAIILIAGNSTRLHSDTPKQFILVNEVPLFVYTTSVFNNAYEVDDIILVTKKDSVDFVKEQVNKFHLNKVSVVCEGGATRQESVFKGLTCKTFSDNDVILIHDGARALVSERIINDNINACKEFQAVVTALNSFDTLLTSEENLITGYVPRDNIYKVQTPQTFKYKIIKSAHDKNIGKNMSDDSALVNMYFPVHIVPGDNRNFKITNDEDLAFFKEIIAAKTI